MILLNNASAIFSIGILLGHRDDLILLCLDPYSGMCNPIEVFITIDIFINSHIGSTKLYNNQCSIALIKSIPEMFAAFTGKRQSCGLMLCVQSSR